MDRIPLGRGSLRASAGAGRRSCAGLDHPLLRPHPNRQDGESSMRNFILAATVLIGGATVVLAQSPSPNGVKTLAPEGAIKTTGTWDVGTRAGDFVFVAGMRGIDPKTNTLVQGDEARIRQAFLNRSEERRVGKECRSRGAPDQQRKTRQ